MPLHRYLHPEYVNIVNKLRLTDGARRLKNYPSLFVFTFTNTVFFDTDSSHGIVHRDNVSVQRFQCQFWGDVYCTVQYTAFAICEEPQELAGVPVPQHESLREQSSA